MSDYSAYRRRRSETISWRDYSNKARRTVTRNGMYYGNLFHSGSLSEFFVIAETGYESKYMYTDSADIGVGGKRYEAIFDMDMYEPHSYELMMLRIQTEIAVSMWCISEWLFDIDQLEAWNRYQYDPIFNQKMQEEYYEIFGRPKILRWQHDCMNCIPLFKHGWFDAYFCTNHEGSFSQYVVLLYPSNEGTYTISGYATHSASLRRMMSAAAGTQEFTYPKEIERVLKLAYRYLFDNFKSFNPLVLDREYERMMTEYRSTMQFRAEQRRA